MSSLDFGAWMCWGGGSCGPGIPQTTVWISMPHERCITLGFPSSSHEKIWWYAWERFTSCIVIRCNRFNVAAQICCCLWSEWWGITGEAGGRNKILIILQLGSPKAPKTTNRQERERERGHRGYLLEHAQTSSILSAATESFDIICTHCHWSALTESEQWETWSDRLLRVCNRCRGFVAAVDRVLLPPCRCPILVVVASTCFPGGFEVQKGFHLQSGLAYSSNLNELLVQAHIHTSKKRNRIAVV